MNLERRERIKMYLQKCLQELEQDDVQSSAAIISELKTEIRQLTLQEKLAFTLQELSERTSIPVKTLYGYEKKGILKTTEPDKGKKIVLKEDVINFLNTIRSKK